MKAKIFSLGLLLHFFQFHAISQQSNFKPPIDSAAIKNWASLYSSNASITSDGKYFMYDVGNLPPGSKSLFVQEIQGRWKKQIVGIQRAYFSSDGKQVFYQNNDTLYFQKLGTSELKLASNVTSFKQPEEAKGNWLAYRFKNDDLILQNLLTGKEDKYTSVIDYSFDKKGKVLLVKSKNQTGTESLTWINLSNGVSKMFWNEDMGVASRYSFDEESHQLVFLIQQKQNGKTFNSIWYYNIGMDKAIMKVNNQTKGINPGMLISNSPAFFSKNGRYMFFSIEQEPVVNSKANPDAVQVDVWNYKDLLLQENQLAALKGNISAQTPSSKELFICMITANKENAAMIGQVNLWNTIHYGPGDIIIKTSSKYTGDKTWEKPTKEDYIIDLKESGQRKLLMAGDNISSPIFSKNGEQIIYYDYKKRDVTVFKLSNSLVPGSEMTFSFPFNHPNESRTFHPEIKGWNGTFSGWLSDNSMIIDDGYDLFRMGINTGNLINLTNGYGRKHNLRFRIVNPNYESSELPSYSENQSLLLTAFSSENKQNGFYRVHFGSIKDPELLTMGSYVYYTKAGQTPMSMSYIGGKNPIKAENKEAFIVSRSSATEAPEYFFTSDFKSFRQLTDYQPQEKYNWVTSELITWIKPDGKTAQGVLYKPENFDIRKKYPVIIHYYEGMSDHLNSYELPEISGGPLNIPWVVSRGYMVFTPDIDYIIGEPGESVINSVVSGARFLAKRSYIDSTRMGLQGQSWGGYETNYLVTHTNLFAAANTTAGITNFISHYGGLVPSGSPPTIHFEEGHQMRLEKTMWENLDIYIKNSPIFNVTKATTPLLMVHNKMDGTVPWGPAVEFFVAFRRLNKPAWMLQYDGSGHGVYGNNNIMDFNSRRDQFFDHFLKGAPAPVWMTRGIPAKLKGIENGYAYDPSGSCGKDCKVCKMWNEHMRKDSTEAWKEIEEKKKSENWQ